MVWVAARPAAGAGAADVDGGAGKGLRNGRRRMESPLTHFLDQDERALTEEYLLGAEQRSNAEGSDPPLRPNRHRFARFFQRV
jgi:hypothetical protein